MRVDTASLTTTATSVRDLERRSSAATLSDMEVFIFPELMYSLVLANIMSPRLWRWRDDPWFADLPRLTPYRRVLRLRQYIMDHYAFNLDLDTWGLTSKERELARFRGYVSPETLAQSNALFGYEGDRYYFDIVDHNGLVSDEDGMEFQNMDEAIAEARRALGGWSRMRSATASTCPSKSAFATATRDRSCSR